MKALISVSDKTGVVEFAAGLVELGYEIVSTGGTAATMTSHSIPVTSISEVTGFPEILDGRVKTLHPIIYGGILGRRDLESHRAQMSEHGMETIDLVAVNLYPFVDTVAKPGVSEAEVIENIDIGGPSMIRAAAKNHRDVLVIVDPADYQPILRLLGQGGVGLEERRRLAGKAYQHTAAYDTAIAAYFRSSDERLPEHLTVELTKVQGLRYGENPHQQAAFYSDLSLPAARTGLAGVEQLNGKTLSFCNMLDVDAAWASACSFTEPAVSIIKHSNPCGLAVGETEVAAYQAAHAGDPISAFGGAIGVNRPVGAELARLIVQHFYEDVIAPEFSGEALEILQVKKNLRVLRSRTAAVNLARLNPLHGLDVKRVAGGILLQTLDTAELPADALRVVSKAQPSEDMLAELRFAWKAVRFIKSNAIVLTRNRSTVGVGAGQMSRVDSVEIAVRKAGDRAKGSVLASDAFFPKPDGVELAAQAGIAAIIQPGGSIKDDEAIAMADRYGVVMIFTGMRHFRH